MAYSLRANMKSLFSLILPTAYGQMIVNRNDINQTGALLRTGYAPDNEEIVLLSTILETGRSDSVLVDAGANIGTYALGLSKSVGKQGRIHAFEAQRIIFNMLAGSVALNSLLNVYCYNLALGEREGEIEVPQFDYSQPLNFGSIEFTENQAEKLTQERQRDPEKLEYVKMMALDQFQFDRVDLLKIDVEGMEMSVLRGAEQTISRCRPVMFVEFIKSDRHGLKQHIANLGYEIFENRMNYLCVPSEQKGRIRLVDGSITAGRLA